MQDNLFLGKVPERMIVGIWDSTAFNGDKEKYPFAFHKEGVTAVRQFIEGEEYPYVTLELNGANYRKDLRGYRRFLEAAGAVGKHREFMVKPDEWDKIRIVLCSCGTTCLVGTRMALCSVPSRPE